MCNNDDKFICMHHIFRVHITKSAAFEIFHVSITRFADLNPAIAVISSISIDDGSGMLFFMHEISSMKCKIHVY